MKQERPSQLPPGSRGHLFTKLVLVCFSVLFSLCGVELWIRFQGHFRQTKAAEDWSRVRTQRTQAANLADALGLGHIIRLSEHKGVIYQLLPNLKHPRVFGATLETNSLGFRGPECGVTPDPDLFRILVIGDSVAFGQGVGTGRCYPRILESSLLRQLPDRRIEVVNMGIPGFNTAMEVDFLIAAGLNLEPDLVMIDFVGNDFDLPNFVSTNVDFWSLKRSFLLDWVVRGFRPFPQAGEPLEPALFVGGRYANRKEDVSEEYRYMVGHDGYREAMRRLKRLSDNQGFAVVMSAHYDSRPIVQEMSEACGFPLLRGIKAINQHLESLGKPTDLATYLDSELVISNRDPHPSELGHSIIGEHYARRLIAESLIGDMEQ